VARKLRGSCLPRKAVSNGPTNQESEVILNGASAWAKAVGRRAVKDPVSRRTVNAKNSVGTIFPKSAGFFGYALPATFARRALFRLRMTSD
jgi:hypothetical protein